MVKAGEKILRGGPGLWYHRDMDEVRFAAAAARAQLRKPEGGGIGILGEKTLHSALKYYYEPDSSFHEREAWGFLADVYNEEGVIEIQTRGLWSLKRKLPVYLEHEKVTLVHPIVRKRRLIYLDTETGELSPPRLSPSRGSLDTAFGELIHVREFLSHPNLLVVVPFVDADEYRVRLEKKKRRRVPNVKKFELVPTALIEEWVFACPEDWSRLVPEALLSGGFTVKEFAAATKRDEYTARLVLGTLLHAGALRRVREGRSYSYYLPNGENENEDLYDTDEGIEG